MQWKVLRSLPLQDVQNKLDEYTIKYGSLSHLHEEFIKGRIPPGVFQDYVEWTSMDHAVRAYQEGEDFEYLAEEDLDFTPEDYSKLTPRRLELLDSLTEGSFNSINEFAGYVERDVKNVYTDLKTLESLGLVQLIKEGRNTIPELLVHEITLLLG
ncbi:MAG: hypothetical protein NWE89_09925 [Candidatus Bathyarchaeota archaeon]|nr:hypothetical protein [Candidatus Bathyarchaeota archaeon]